MISYRDKIIWITGASSGIGEACAKAFYRRGAKLIVSGRDEKRLANITCEVEAILSLAFDASKADQWQKAVADLQDKKIFPDLILLNAGSCQYLDWPDFDLSIIEQINEVNYLGTIYGIKNSLDLLLEKSGSQLAVMSSSSDCFAFSRAEAYGSSKAAISYFVRSLKTDLQYEDISISLIRPGFVKTPLTDKNDFPMPFRITAENAALRIVKSLSQRQEEIAFPKRFTLPLSIISKLPQGLQNKLAKWMHRS